MSPNEFLNSLNNNNRILEKPWSIINNQKEKNITEFNFDENKKEIDKKLENIMKQLPVLSCVKLATSRRQLSKGEYSEKWTIEDFYIRGFKRPLVYTEPVLVKVIDLKGDELKGVFRHNELKLVPTKVVFTVTNIINTKRFKNQIKI